MRRFRVAALGYVDGLGVKVGELGVHEGERQRGSTTRTRSNWDRSLYAVFAVAAFVLTVARIQVNPLWPAHRTGQAHAHSLFLCREGN